MASTRERMITSTALLIRERGARATSIDDVLAHSGAPRGSVYHHFPGGVRSCSRRRPIFAGDYIAAPDRARSDTRSGSPRRAPSTPTASELVRERLPRRLPDRGRGGRGRRRGFEPPRACRRGLRALALACSTDKLIADGIGQKRAGELATLVHLRDRGRARASRASRRDPEPLRQRLPGSCAHSSRASSRRETQ